MDLRLRLLERHAALRQLVRQIGDLLILLPVGLPRIDRRAGPHRRERKLAAP